LKESIEISLYRITIELINNTFKYASSKNIFISLLKEKDLVTYTFEHDGKGFNYKETLSKKMGMGLFNIEQRVSVLKGHFNINTSESSNLKLIITFNIDSKIEPNA